MATDEPRRFLIAVGVDRYASKKWKSLPDAPQEVDTVVKALTGEPFRLKRVLVNESAMPERSVFLRALALWSTSDERRPDDHVVIYWSGHGVIESDILYLILPDTLDPTADGLTVDDLVNNLMKENSAISRVLLLLDVCNAGHVAINLGPRLATFTRQRALNNMPCVAAICAAGPRTHARQLFFANAFVKALESCQDRDKRLSPSLNLSELAEKIQRALENTRQRPFSFHWHSGSWAFFRNRYHVSHWPYDLDPGTQRLLESIDVASRGVDAPEAHGWFFKGRKQVFAELCRWLCAGSGPAMCWVTGGVGAGKSAVLGRLYTLSRRDLVCRMPPAVVGQTECPPVGSIDAMVLLSRKDLPEVVTAIAQCLGVAADNTKDLVSKLESGSRRRTLIVDSLDEAGAPDDTLDLLEKLAAGPVRVIVAARRSPVGGLQPNIEIDLEAIPYADHGAVREYTLDRLKAELHGRTNECPPAQQDLETAADEVVKRAKGNFLFARLLVTDLAQRNGVVPDMEQWDFPKSFEQCYVNILGMQGDDQTAIVNALVPLAYAEGGGLPKGHLWLAIAERLGVRERHRLDVSAVIDKVPWFIVENLRDGRSVYQLFHTSLAEYLRKGREAREVHQQIADVLRESLKPGGSAQSLTPDDALYARRYLSRHLRRAGATHELERLVSNPEWIAHQCTSYTSRNYAADVEEARESAREANLNAIPSRRGLPGLAGTVWWLIWRSALVTLVEDIPPAAWAFMVRNSQLAPADALHTVASTGNRRRLAGRLIALARVLTGNDLDTLLDFAEGLEVALDAPGSADPVGTRNPAAPGKPALTRIDDPDEETSGIYRYARTLRAALDGADAKRLVPRALAAATRMQGYSRWYVLEVLLDDLDAAQLEVAHELIEGMPQAGHDPWWHIVAQGNIKAVRVLRGYDDAIGLPSDSFSWWIAVAILFARDGGARSWAADLSLTDELIRADQSIADWLYRLEIMTVLVAAMREVETTEQRSALARYLKALRDRSRPNLKIRMLAEAVTCLDKRRRMRLLVWAKQLLERAVYREDDYANMNWYFTPPRLARAFAHEGDLRSALSVVSHTQADDILRDMASEETVRAFRCDTDAAKADASQALIDFHAQTASFETLQLLAAAAGTSWPTDDVSKCVADTLSRYHIQLAKANREVRCMVNAALARYARQPAIRLLLRKFLALSPSPAAKQYFAANCAIRGHADIAIELVAPLDSFEQSIAWTAVLSAATEASFRVLVLYILQNREAMKIIADDDKALCSLLRIVCEATPDLLSEIEQLANAVPAYALPPAMIQLTEHLAIRGFEVGNEALAMRQLAKCEQTHRILLASQRLTLEKRRAFIALAGKIAAPSTKDMRLPYKELADLLSATPEDAVAASARIASAIESVGTRSPYFGEPPFLDLLSESDQRRVVAYAFSAQKEFLGERHLSSFTSHFGWMLRWLDADAIGQLMQCAHRQDDDYYREEAIVALLPRFAELRGWQAAMKLREPIRRVDHESLSWTALLPCLPDRERELAFRKLIPVERSYYDQGASTLGKIAHLLKDHEAINAIRWIVKNFSGGQARLLVPFINVALQKPRMHIYLVWEAIVTEGARLRSEDAMDYLCIAIPLLAKLGGQTGLEHIRIAMTRATEQWP